MKQLLDTLVEELKDKSEYTRQHAARKLGKLGNKKAVKYLKDSLDDHDRNVRLKVIEALGEIGGIEASEVLLTYLQEANIDIELKKAIINALGDTGDYNNIKLLEGFLGEREIKLDVIKALGKSGYTKPLFDAISEGDTELADQVSYLLGQLCTKSDVPYLLKTLTSTGWNVRAGAIEALGRLRQTDSLLHIARLADDPNDNVRSQVSRALGKMADDRAIPYLIKSLKDRYWDVRRNAAEALGNLESEEAVEGLIEKLKDENSGVRNNVAEALGKIKARKAILPLLEALKDEDAAVRGNSAKSLGLMGYVEAREGLELALQQEQDPWVKRYLDEAISYLQLEPDTMVKKKILLVDDDKFIVKLLRITLQEDYDTIVAYNGEEAVMRAKVELPHLILLDIMMPKMDGLEVIQALKMDKSTISIPVIIVSAKSQDKDLENIKKMGVTGYIRKPFNTVKLLQMVVDALKGSEG
jgi:HEAT repeat protein/CheY-like chemotaxis protein